MYFRKLNTIEDAINAASEQLPNGYIIDISIEKEGYGVSLTKDNFCFEVDGGGGMLSDILEAVEMAKSTR